MLQKAQKVKNARKITSFFGITLAFTSLESLQASGFRLTEQSLNGTALNSAFVAGAYGADSTYYNPANMGFGKDSEKWEFEVNGTMIIIPGFDFDTENRDKGINVVATSPLAGQGHYCEVNGQSSQTSKNPSPSNLCGAARVNGKANTTVQPVPKFFLKSRAFHLPLGLRLHYGFSFTTPSGLAMDWDGQGGGFLDDVSIAMLELNPVVSLTWKDFIAIGAGFRAIYTFGNFNNTLYVPFDYTGNQPIVGNVQSYGATKVTQASDGSAWGFGYNLALSMKPFAFFESDFLKGLTLSATYRSKLSMEMGGTLSANSYIYQGTGLSKVEGYITMNANLNLLADLPTILNLAIAQDFGKHRLEFVFERTFWGRARIFEFVYSNQVFDKSNLGGTGSGFVKPDEMLGAADYSAVAYGNGWKSSNAYRLGYTYFGDGYTIMGSLAYDETPAPQGKFGIPDANAYMFGLGYRKRFLEDKLDIGAAYSLALKDNRESFIVSRDGFGQLHLVTIGAKFLW